jgi:glycogen debranching enzyme
MHAAEESPALRDPAVPPDGDAGRYVSAEDTPSVTRSIADAVVLKEGDLFLLTLPDGRIPLTRDHGFGLYYHDCRYLNGYDLRVAGIRPDVLVASTEQGFKAIFQLTTPDVLLADAQVLPKEHLGLKWERVIDPEGLALHDVLEIENFGLAPLALPLSLTFRAAFEDIFAVRGVHPQRRGRPEPPHWDDGALRFAYQGVDGLCRSMTIYFSRPPDEAEGTTAVFHLRLAPRERQQVLVSLALAEAAGPCEPQPGAWPQPDLGRVAGYLQRSADQWLAHETRVRSNNLALTRVLNRSLRDLRMLRSRLDGREYFAAGVPWYATLFGRDSLVTALQMLAFDPAIAAQTLRLLAAYQGEREDPWRDEQPGKIPHELRVGEMARTDQIPHTPYYGTIDATLLFLILVARHATWTGSLALFHELRGNIERALAWVAEHGDLDGDGYVEYVCRSDQGLANQGWKDAGDAIVTADGRLATPPIALVEVQGYVYLAKAALADLYDLAGEPDFAARLRGEAAALRERFNRDFWLEAEGCYALALEEGKRPCAVVSSNPGQALWTGIAAPAQAWRTADRLLADDMFSGWGIRTLSARERRYNPISYQLGSVWPHDNALIAAGLRHYGHTAGLERIFVGLMEAALHFPDNRLPELFTGFSRQEYGVPVSYPVACRPQAWAAGAIPHLLESLLGLQPAGFERTLRVVRPILPAFIEYLEVHRLRVAGAAVDLHFERTRTGGIAVDILGVEGDLAVAIEPGIAGR